MINVLKKKISDLISRKKYNSSQSTKKIVKFIFNIKYLFLLFILSILTYLVTPKFYNYETKANIIKKKLKEDYDIKIKDYSKIDYSLFPYPRINLKNVDFLENNSLLDGKVKNLIISFNLRDIHNLKKANINVIKFEDSTLNLNTGNFKNFIKYLNNLNKKIEVISSILILEQKKNEIIKLTDIQILNKLNDKIELQGKYFGNKFNLLFLKNENNNILKIDIKKLGINLYFDLDEKSNLEKYSGELKAKVLNTNSVINFKFDKKLEIYNSFVRNKNIETSFKGFLNLNPYFFYNIDLNVKKINLTKIFKSKKDILPINELNSLKKFNGNINIRYDEKKFKNTFFNKILSKLILENGEVLIDKSDISFDGGSAKFTGRTSKINSSNKFIFDFLITINDQKKIKNWIKDKKNKKDIPSSINLNGNLNLFSNKINIEKIVLNNEFIVPEEDLIYYSDSYNEIVLKKHYTNFINLERIKVFLKEIY